MNHDFLTPIASGLLGVWAGYRLGRSERKADRRRARRLRPLDIAAQAGGHHPMHLWRWLGENRPEIARLVREADDEAAFSIRRRRIRRHGDWLLGLGRQDVEPAHGCGKEEFQKARSAVAAALEALAKVA